MVLGTSVTIEEELGSSSGTSGVEGSVGCRLTPIALRTPAVVVTSPGVAWERQMNKKKFHISLLPLCVMIFFTIEDARTKRGSSHIGCKMRKWQKHYVLAYTLHNRAVSTSVSYTCFEHPLTMKLTDGRNWSPVVETDTNSIFKIL